MVYFLNAFTAMVRPKPGARNSTRGSMGLAYTQLPAEPSLAAYQGVHSREAGMTSGTRPGIPGTPT